MMCSFALLSDCMVENILVLDSLISNRLIIVEKFIRIFIAVHVFATITNPIYELTSTYQVKNSIGNNMGEPCQPYINLTGQASHRL